MNILLETHSENVDRNNESVTEFEKKMTLEVIYQLAEFHSDGVFLKEFIGLGERRSR